ncbi:uncharacterized protein LOC123538886 isoform X2 [Mercenaria mercenaria]|uniref:uncharacterized protein LOC123538886 isoform X2 n=1 Tax=Mercenaria mercenaria TaxID=6596 RepID=UPI00234F11C1|nr:uncharacterized protein LOC123538886 isoform X2 [Mercenaria mercenaria]
MVDCSTTIRRMDRVNKFLLMSIACIVTIINMGLVFSFGSLFVALMEKFQTDRSTTAAVQSLLVGVTLSFGVVSGILISRIGITLVTFISGILVTAGFCMSYFAVSIYYLYVSIGVVSEIVRQQQRPLAYGLLYTVDGILSTAAGYLLGKFRDVSDSYASVVLTVFGSQLLATILFCIAFASWKHKVSKAMTLDSKEADLLTPSNLQNGCS